MIAVAIHVHELAREFRVESKVILAVLKDMGEYAKSASSTVELPVARRLRDRLHTQGTAGLGSRSTPRSDTQPRDQRPGGNPFSNSQRNTRRAPVGDPNLLAAAKMFGVSPQILRAAPKPKKKWVERKAGTHEMDEWDLRLIDRNERQEWLDAGLGEHDARLADDCKRFGISPDDLQMVVERRVVWDRLRSNEPISIVADMVKVARRSQQESG